MKNIYQVVVISVALMFAGNHLSAQDAAQENNAVDSVKIFAVQVNITKPDDNFGTKHTGNISSELDVLIKVDIDSINLTHPNVDSVFLRLYFKSPTVAGTVGLYDMDVNWIDTIVTWNNAADLTVSDTKLASIDVQSEGNIYTNITEYFNEKFARQTDFGWRVKVDDPATSVTLRTHYRPDENMKPKLIIYSHSDPAVGVSKQDFKSYSVYPNPATDFLRIDLGNNTAGTVVLYNSVGSTVLKKKYSTANISLDLSTIEPGLYFISIESQEVNYQIGKVIIR